MENNYVIYKSALGELYDKKCIIKFSQCEDGTNKVLVYTPYANPATKFIGSGISGSGILSFNNSNY